MKKLLCLCMILFSIACHAQDLIVKTNGEEIKAKVKAVSEKEIEYKKENNLDGPLYKIAKSDVLMIVYATGQKDVFNTNSGLKTEPTSVSSTTKVEYSMIVPNTTENQISVYVNEEVTRYNVNASTVFPTIASILRELGSKGWKIESSTDYTFTIYSGMMKLPPEGIVIFLSRELK